MGQITTLGQVWIASPGSWQGWPRAVLALDWTATVRAVRSGRAWGRARKKGPLVFFFCISGKLIYIDAGTAEFSEVFYSVVAGHSNLTGCLTG